MSNIIYSDICGWLKKEQDIRSFLFGANANPLSENGSLTEVMRERGHTPHVAWRTDEKPCDAFFFCDAIHDENLK